MKKILLILLFPVFCFCTNDETRTADYSQAIDSARIALKIVQDSSQIPGLAVTVMVNGSIVFSEGYGYSDLEGRTPVDPANTLFRIGSVSKSMTSLALGILVEEEKLNLDAQVQEYVPSFPVKKYPITVRQVAGHIAGIRHYRGGEMLNDKYYPTVEEGLEIFQDDSLLFEPGTAYRYSSYGWNLISAVIEGASGEEFLKYMQLQIFDPLHLDHVFADYASEEMPNRTKFYRLSNTGEVVEAPYVDNSYKWAGGGFLSTSEDLARFGQSVLEPTLFSLETRDLLIRSQSINDTTETYYGMGWVSRENQMGQKWFGHSGGSVGGITQLVIYPDSKVVVALVTNSSDVDYRNVHHKLAYWFSEGARN